MCGVGFVEHGDDEDCSRAKDPRDTSHEPRQHLGSSQGPGVAEAVDPHSLILHAECKREDNFKDHQDVLPLFRDG